MDDRHLPLERRVFDPVVQAASLEGVVDVAGAVAGEHDERRRVGAEHADLGNRDLPVGQHLEEVGLELVVGAVDLVDEQHGRYRRTRLDRAQQRPADEEAPLVEVGLEVVAGAAVRLAADLGGAQVEQLAGVVPVVDGLGGVDALVALQADQLATGPRRQDLGHLGLADARLALEEQRPLQASSPGRSPSPSPRRAGTRWPSSAAVTSSTDAGWTLPTLTPAGYPGQVRR